MHFSYLNYLTSIIHVLLFVYFDRKSSLRAKWGLLHVLQLNRRKNGSKVKSSREAASVGDTKSYGGNASLRRQVQNPSGDSTPQHRSKVIEEAMRCREDNRTKLEATTRRPPTATRCPHKIFYIRKLSPRVFGVYKVFNSVEKHSFCIFLLE